MPPGKSCNKSTVLAAWKEKIRRLHIDFKYEYDFWAVFSLRLVPPYTRRQLLMIMFVRNAEM